MKTGDHEESSRRYAPGSDAYRLTIERGIFNQERQFYRLSEPVRRYFADRGEVSDYFLRGTERGDYRRAA